MEIYEKIFISSGCLFVITFCIWLSVIHKATSNDKYDKFIDQVLFFMLALVVIMFSMPIIEIWK